MIKALEALCIFCGKKNSMNMSNLEFENTKSPWNGHQTHHDTINAEMQALSPSISTLSVFVGIVQASGATSMSRSDMVTKGQTWGQYSISYSHTIQCSILPCHFECSSRTQTETAGEFNPRKTSQQISVISSSLFFIIPGACTDYCHMDWHCSGTEDSQELLVTEGNCFGIAI